MPMNFLNLLQRPLRRSGRKAVAMPQISVPVSPPADDRLGRLIDAIGQLAQQQRSLLEALRPQGPALTPSPATQPYTAAPISAAPPAVAADLRSFVADLFREHATSAQQSAAREAYVRQHLADLPEAYRRQMPDTADVAALADAEQTLRRQYRDDLRSVRKLSGEPAGTVGGDHSGGQPPAAAIDYGKLSPMQQIALGLKSASSPAAAIGAPVAGDSADAPRDMLNGEPLFVGAD